MSNGNDKRLSEKEFIEQARTLTPEQSQERPKISEEVFIQQARSLGGQPDQEALSFGEKFRAIASVALPPTVGGSRPTLKGTFGEGALSRIGAPAAALAAGTIESGFIEPAANLAGLFSYELKRRALTEGSLQELAGHLDRFAMRNGLTEEDIEQIHTAGDFIGFTVPMVASFKTVGAVLRLGGKTIGLPGMFLRDAAAGGVYGGLFEDADSLSQRVGNVLNTSAEFAVFSLALGGLLQPMIAYSHKRAVTKATAVEASRRFNLALERGTIDPETGVQILRAMDRESGQFLAEIFNEQVYISASPRARELLRRGADEAAVIRGLMDMAGSDGSHVIVRDLTTDPKKVLPRLKEAFGDNVKFSFVKNDKGLYDVIAGDKGVTGKLLGQFKREGRFEGQKISVSGARGYEYVRKIDDEFAWARLEGETKLRRVKLKNIQDLDFGIPPEARDIQELAGRDIISLSDEFQAWLDGKINEAVASREGVLTEAAAARLARGETAQLRYETKRQVSAGPEVQYQEELGLATDGFPPNRPRAHEATPFRGGGTLGVADAEGRNIGRIKVGINPTEPETLVLQIDDNLKNLSRGEIEGLAVDAVNIAEKSGFKISRVRDPSGRKLFEAPMKTISETGFEDIQLLVPDEVGSFDDMVEIFLKENDIFDAADIQEFKVFAAQQFRARILRELPEREAKLLDEIRTEFLDHINAAEFTIEDLGALAGYKVERAGPAVAARRINDGSVIEFQSVEAAEAFFKSKRVDQYTDLVHSGKIPPTIFGTPGPASAGGLPIPDTTPIFDDLKALQYMDDVVPLAAFTNLRDWMLAVERKTNGAVRLWSSVFEPIDEGVRNMNNVFLGDKVNIERVYNKLTGFRGSYKSRLKVQSVWREAFSDGVGKESDIVRIARLRGLNPDETTAAVNGIRLLDQGFREINLNAREFLRFYYTEMVPKIESGMLMSDFMQVFGDNLPTEIRAFFRYMQTGEMARQERDPLLLTLKWFRSLRFEQNVASHWRNAKAFTGELDAILNRKPSGFTGGEQERIIRALGDRHGAELLKNTMDEFLDNVRGLPNQDVKAMRRLSGKLFKRLGVTDDPKVVEDLINSYLSTIYGAAMGMRPMLVTRNLVQNWGTTYLKLGAEFAEFGMKKALTLEGFKKAWADGAIRSQAKGVAFGDVVFENFYTKANFYRGGNVFNHSIRSATRGTLALGRLNRKVTEKMLIPYTSADDINRTVAYWWQRGHTEKYLRMLQRGEISESKFLQKGMPMYDKEIKSAFIERLDKFGEEAALGFIGKMAADESHFIYGMAAQPLWMQRAFGQMIGQFGTWPIWYKEYVKRAMRNGTMAERALFTARLALVSGAIANTAIESGMDIWSWIAPTSMINWGGGPVVQTMVNIRDVTTAPMTKKPQAATRIIKDIGRLSWPGQTFYRDISLALETAPDAVTAGAYLMIGRPEKSRVRFNNFIFDEEILAPPPMGVSDPNKPKPIPLDKVFPQ